MIAPGAWLGVLGGGQLGRMFTMAAHRLGYRVMVLDPDPQSTAGAVADTHLCAELDDASALNELTRICAGVTVETETRQPQPWNASRAAWWSALRRIASLSRRTASAKSASFQDSDSPPHPMRW